MMKVALALKPLVLVMVVIWNMMRVALYDACRALCIAIRNVRSIQTRTLQSPIMMCAVSRAFASKARANLCQTTTTIRRVTTTQTSTTIQTSTNKDCKTRKRPIPKDVLDYMQHDMPYPPYVYEALGETFSQKDLERLLMSMAK